MSRDFWLRAKHLKRRRGPALCTAALVALWGLWSAAVTPCAAGNAAAGAAGPSGNPVRIQSEQLVAEKNFETAEFSGQVRVEADAYTITAESLTVQFKPTAEGQTRSEATISAKDIARITARGRVLIRTDTLTASADEAVYEPDLERISLTAREVASPSPSAAKDRRRAASPPRMSSTQRWPASERVRVTVLPAAGLN